MEVGIAETPGATILQIPCNFGPPDSLSGAMSLKVSPLRRLPGIIAGLAFALMQPVASAQWSVTVTELGGGPGNSIAFGAAGGQQVGLDGLSAAHATTWAGSAGSAVDLNPAGATWSRLWVTTGTQQGGTASFTNTNGTNHAALWSGTAGSFVDLHPANGASSSIVQALTGTQQGGSAIYSGLSHATLWNGTAGSFLDLHPAGATESGIMAMWAGNQAGYATIGGQGHAALWSGTAASFLDLNPAGATGSVVHAMDAAGQAGTAYFGSTPHAALWNGTAGSFLDLNPVGTNGSLINAVAGGFQAGAAVYSGNTHAALWNGTAASYYDFHTDITAALGANYTSSILWGAEWSGSTLFLVGEAIDPVTTSSTAIMLTVAAIPEPGTSAATAAALALGAVAWVRARRKIS